MDRLLFIVSQGRRQLYDSLKQVLSLEKDVEVILDRREVKRRRHEAPPAMERRRYGRRGRPTWRPSGEDLQRPQDSTYRSSSIRVRCWIPRPLHRICTMSDQVDRSDLVHQPLRHVTSGC